ncbi:hypothetical protein IF1G_07567 [Cordyceps javanica]|uniref:Uncharacterized protein n=1 Tax=Cordyceps javanica TaxID=43265 RepID=A0A545UWJ5_9HYPO|nr:hypothetical protein IF1G_07567 [Cordyceps javanica]TQW04618.1 hypothetical protein IF2G_07847 [Cordyceps javanica]
MKFQLLATIAATLATQVIAAPSEFPNGPRIVKIDDSFPHGIGGALDKVGEPTTSNKQTNSDRVRITYINRDNTSIIIGHSLDPSSPNAGAYGDFHLGVGQDRTLEYFNGFRGMAHINLDSPGYRLTKADESGVEVSYVNSPGIGLAGDVDVSYVDGFSRSISCKCLDNSRTVGCSKELWALHHCPDDNRVGSCKNPKRNDDHATSPTEFFAPCTYHGGAFTYPRADANTLYNGCPSERYVCCIGHGDECMRYNNNPRK